MFKFISSLRGSVLAAFTLSVFLTYIVAVIMITQLNLAAIAELGYPVSPGVRALSSIADVQGMLSLYLPIIVVALLLAYSFTRWCLSRIVSPGALLYVAAGFTAIVTVHLLIQVAFGLPAVAPTRTFFGLISQGLAGGLGGWLYHWILYQRS